MRKLLLLAGCLTLVTATLLPKPSNALISCTRFCSGFLGQSCAQQGLGCGQVCDEFGQCTCGCI